MAKDLGIDMETFTKQCRVFELLDEVGRQRMMDVAEPEDFAPGQVVMREGEVGTAMFVVRSGILEVTVEAFEGERRVAKLGAGSVVGEIAMVSGQPRSATVVARDTVQTWRFAKADLESILRDYPNVRELLARLGLKRSELTLEKMLGDDDA